MLFSLPRGWDATGIAGIKENKEVGKKGPLVNYYKRALHFVDYAETRGARRMLEKFSDFYYVIGHVRAGTVGAGDDASSHPFYYEGPHGDITLVHNGTIDKLELKAKAEESVDSAHITASMAEYGETETLEKLDGGFSLVWHNTADDSLNFARNDKKPMAIAFVHGSNEMYYASEWMTLFAVLERQGIKYEEPILIPRPLTHLKFHKEDLRAFTTSKFKAYSRPSYPSTGMGAWNHDRRLPVVHEPRKETTPQKNSTTSKDTTTTLTKSTVTDGGVGYDTDSSRQALCNPANSRITYINKELHTYGLSFGQTVVLRPVDWAPYAGGNVGRLVLQSFDAAIPHSFVMYQVDRLRWETYHTVGRVSCTIRNFIDRRNQGNEMIIVLENHDHQKVIERNPDSIASSEGSKSEEIAEAELVGGRLVNTETGEVVDVNDAEVIADNSRSIEGPNGGLLTPREFRELAKAGCGSCDGDIDPHRPDLIRWHNGACICEGCHTNPVVMAQLTGEKVH